MHFPQFNWPKSIYIIGESLIDSKYPDSSKLKISINIYKHENCLEINVKSKKIYLDFIDPDFETKAKQIIKLIDDQVVKKIN